MFDSVCVPSALGAGMLTHATFTPSLVSAARKVRQAFDDERVALIGTAEAIFDSVKVR
jgi:C4-dicarboxylate transporter